MSINVVGILNNFSKNISSAGFQQNYANRSVDENIFAQAKEIVSKYKTEKENNSTTTDNTSKLFFGTLTATQLANMSTSDFLNYAYENKANSGYTENKQDNSEIKLPKIVAFGSYTFTTGGKNFMSIVMAIKGKYPHKSEEEIAAKLIAKYDTSKSATGNSVNISA